MHINNKKGRYVLDGPIDFLPFLPTVNVPSCRNISRGADLKASILFSSVESASLMINLILEGREGGGRLVHESEGLDIIQTIRMMLRHEKPIGCIHLPNVSERSHMIEWRLSLSLAY